MYVLVLLGMGLDVTPPIPWSPYTSSSVGWNISSESNTAVFWHSIYVWNPFYFYFQYPLIYNLSFTYLSDVYAIFLKSNVFQNAHKYFRLCGSQELVLGVFFRVCYNWSGFFKINVLSNRFGPTYYVIKHPTICNTLTVLCLLPI